MLSEEILLPSPLPLSLQLLPRNSYLLTQHPENNLYWIYHVAVDYLEILKKLAAS